MTEHHVAQEYAHVMSPLQVGNVELPNRIVRTSHGTGLSDAGIIGDKLVAYHLARARGGVGCTFIEATTVHPSDGTSLILRSWDDSAIRGYEKLMAALEGQPMRVMAQLLHSGFAGPPLDGGPPWSASALPAPDSGRVAISISKSQIEELVESYGAAARRVAEGGLHGVEVHGAHGYLLGQFLSPLTNHREDEYGGTEHGRRRFLIEALRATRAAVPTGFPVGVRLSAAEGVEGGLTVDDAIAIAQSLEADGLVDFVNISLGSRYAYDNIFGSAERPDGYELPYSGPVAAAVKVPTIVTGRIRTLAHADQIVRDGIADLVSMVRATIADPDIVAKSLRGEARQVRPCIGCNQLCVGGLHGPSARIGCAVNPQAGRELTADPQESATDSERPIVVIGGGPCGLEAARVAAAAGRRVILHEESDTLGGQLRLARQVPHRETFGELADWFVSEIARLGVEVQLRSVISPRDLADIDAETVIVATGSRPRRDGLQARLPAQPVVGVDLPHVHTSWEAIDGTVSLSGNVLVVDDVGHYEAIGVAEYLLERGARVTLATSQAQLAPQLEGSNVDFSAKRRLMRDEMTFIPDVLLLEVTPKQARLRAVWSRQEQSIPVDAVVLVSHNIARGAEFANLALSDGSLARLAGDALSPRFLHTAIAEGNAAAVAAIS